MILDSKGALQTILKLIIHLWLFGLFLLFFGHPAMKRYQEKKVLVVTSRRGTEGTQALAVTICHQQEKTNTSWKREGWAGFAQTLCNDANTTNHRFMCVLGFRSSKEYFVFRRFEVANTDLEHLDIRDVSKISWTARSIAQIDVLFPSLQTKFWWGFFCFWGP